MNWKKYYAEHEKDKAGYVLVTAEEMGVKDLEENIWDEIESQGGKCAIGEYDEDNNLISLLFTIWDDAEEELKKKIAKTKTKFLRITDIYWDNSSCQDCSKQLDIIAEIDEEVWHDGMLQDNGGDPDGNIFCVYYNNYDAEAIQKAIEAGAEVIEMYKADYKQDIREELEDTITGDWTGYTDNCSAWFINLDDAVKCQKLYDNWYRKEYEE